MQAQWRMGVGMQEQDGVTATHSMLPPTKRVIVKEREPTA